MKMLVTGGTGFVGSPVVDILLEGGHSVRLFSRRSELPARLRGKSVELHHGDLQDEASLAGALSGMDVLVHIGEIANTSARNAEKNVALVKAVLPKLAAAGVRRLVFISSVSVGGIPETIPATEETPAAITLSDHYTDYKRRCEELIIGHSRELECVILRLPLVYGPGSSVLPRLLPLFRRVAPIGLPFLGKGNNLVPLVHVQDLAQAIAAAAELPGAARRVLNITDGERHSWRDLFSALAGALGVGLRIVPVPPVLVRVPALLGDLLSGLLRLKPDLSHYIDFLTSDVHFDNGRAREVLGWTPSHTSLPMAMKELVKSGTS